MFAFCNAAVAKALLILVGFITDGIRAPATDVSCTLPVVAVSVQRAAADTARTARPKRPSKPVTITITDDGINVDGEEAMKLEIETEKLEELSKKLSEEALRHIEGLPESIEAILGDEYDAKRFIRIRGSDVVEFGHDVTIDEDELVNGNVVTIFSDIRIDGKVTGDVAAIFGTIELGPGAIVNGEAVSIFGSIEREDGSVIRGETAVIGGHRPHGGLTLPLSAFGEGLFGGVAKILSFIIGILLMLILLFFIPRRMRAAADYTASSFPKSIGMGLLLFFGGIVLVVILAIILAITIVGIPVAVLLVFSFLALLGIGYSVSALALGSFITRRFGIETDSIYLQAIAGLFLLAILGIIASFMKMHPLFGPMQIMLRVVGGILQFAALLAGVGAFILSRAGSRPREIAGASAEGTAQP